MQYTISWTSITTIPIITLKELSAKQETIIPVITVNPNEMYMDIMRGLNIYPRSRKDMNPNVM